MEKIIEKFNKITENLNSITESKNNILKKQNDEIENNKKSINKKYENIIKEKETEEKDKKNKIINLNKEINVYSTFNKKELGNIISELMTTIEGKKYVYVKSKHNTYERECTVFGSELFKVEKYVDLIVEKKDASNYYYDLDEFDNKIIKLMNNSKGILLESNDFENKNITLYNFTEDISSKIDYKNFDYVKEFIDIIINYRYENKKEEINKKDLLKLLYDFLTTKKDLILEKHKKIIVEEIKKKQEELLEIEKIKESRLIKNYIPKTLLINNLKYEDKKELEEILNNIEIKVDTTEGIVKANQEKELLSTNLIYISKLVLNGIIKNCECGPWNDWYFTDAEINHEAFIAIYDIEHYNGFYLPYTYFDELPYGSYISKNINDKYYIILYSPDNFYYSYEGGFVLSKCETDEKTILNSLIEIGKYIEEKSNIKEENGKKYILTKKQL